MRRAALALLFALTVLLLVFPGFVRADCCNVYDVNVIIRAPNNQTFLVTNCNYESNSGSCTQTSATTVRYVCNIGFNFCPVEGAYDANFVLSVAADRFCGSSKVVSRLFTDFYEVNYDASPGWCRCRLGDGHWALGGDVDPNACCGDDAGEYVRNCEGDICSSSSDNVACCSSAGDCVFNNTCYPENTGMVVVGGGTYVCRGGSWTNCYPPPTGDWNIVKTCAVSSAVSVAANVWVLAGGVLHVLSGGHVTVGGGYIFVLPGGEIQVDHGGQID